MDLHEPVKTHYNGMDPTANLISKTSIPGNRNFGGEVLNRENFIFSYRSTEGKGGGGMISNRPR